MHRTRFASASRRRALFCLRYANGPRRLKNWPGVIDTSIMRGRTRAMSIKRQSVKDYFVSLARFILLPPNLNETIVDPFTASFISCFDKEETI